MNVRDLKSQLAHAGDEHGLEPDDCPVKMLTEDGLVYDITGVEYEPVSSFEGTQDGPGPGTVWLRVVEE